MPLAHRRRQQCTYFNTLHGGIFLTHSVAIALIPQREHYERTVTVTQKGSIWNWNWLAKCKCAVSVFRNPLHYESVWTGANGMSAEFPTLDLRPIFRLRLNRYTRTLSCLATGLGRNRANRILHSYKLQYKIIALHGCNAADICSCRHFRTTFRSHLQWSSSPIFLALVWLPMFFGAT
jgi:hypothetical protein